MTHICITQIQGGGNYQNYPPNSPEFNREYNPNYNPNYNPGYNPDMYKKKTNTGLIVAISVMSVLAAVIIIIIVLFATNVISPGGSHTDNTPPAESAVQTPSENTAPAEQPAQQPQQQKPVEQPITVERTMFVGNCNVSVTMRTGPRQVTLKLYRFPWQAKYMLSNIPIPILHWLPTTEAEVILNEII